MTRSAPSALRCECAVSAPVQVRAKIVCSEQAVSSLQRVGGTTVGVLALLAGTNDDAIYNTLTDLMPAEMK